MKAEPATPYAPAADDDAFLANHPPAAFFAAVRLRRARRSLARGAAFGTALAACLVFAVVSPAVFDRGGDALRMKGGEANIFAYRKSADGIGLVGPKDVLSAGEDIQLSYFASGPKYAAILSIDGRGAVTRHLPLHGDAALRIETKQFELLPYSYRLDDAPRFEDLYLIVSPEPFAVSAVEPCLRAAFAAGTSALRLPAPLRYATARIVKMEASE
jgi:hypothetical protein